jgi:hypothetical protein
MDETKNLEMDGIDTPMGKMLMELLLKQDNLIEILDGQNITDFINHRADEFYDNLVKFETPEIGESGARELAKAIAFEGIKLS